MSFNCIILLPTRLCRSRFTRQISGLLLLSVILLIICKTELPRNPSPSPPLHTATPLHSGRDVNAGKDTAPVVHHKLLQFNDNVLAASIDGAVHEMDLESRALLVDAEQDTYKEELDKDGAGEREEHNTDEVQINTDTSSHETTMFSEENSNERDKTSLLEAKNHSEVDREQDNMQRDGMVDYHKHTTGYAHSLTHDHCDVSGIESWSRGVLTELHPRISANCDLLKSNNRPEIERVKRDIRSWHSSQSEEEWRESLSDCDKVVKDFSSNFYNSPEEVNFPLAYILVVYTNPQQMVRLIKALWRPQNLFCIHPDAKQSQEFIDVFRQLSKCLDNVFLPAKLEKVYYQHHTIMDSQMNCYKDLLTYPTSRWKYVINLCGRELPLKTNREMVTSLKMLKGASTVESKHVQTKGFLTRDRFMWKAAEDYETGKLHYTNSRLGPPPIPLYKSFNFIAVSQPFVNFIINDHKAIEFRNYLKDVKIPEEEFYASLVHLPGVPGGLPPHRVPLPTVDKYIWMNKNHQTRSKLESCEGRMVHFICIVGVGDLDQIYRWGVQRKPPVFFFNKYFMEDDHVVMDCMEERLLQQNRREYEMDCLHKH